jgi:hypothetical protein
MAGVEEIGAGQPPMSDSVSAHVPPMVIVTGLPRSGTSMMMRMLEAGGLPVIVDGVRAADADNPNGYYEFEPVKALKKDTSWVPGARGKVVKMVYLLLRDLPPLLPYDVIFMRRILAEVVASQDEMLRRTGTEVCRSESERLVGLFRTELRMMEGWLSSRKNFRVLDVDYNRTIENPQETCERIGSFLGLRVDQGKMRSVVTRELYRQRVGPS